MPDLPASGRDRRRFLRNVAGGGLGAGALVLAPDARATPSVGDADHVKRMLALFGEAPEPVVTPERLGHTPQRGRGPFYVPGAPFRAKITWLGQAGTPLLVSGRVWDLRSRTAMPGVIMDIFQVQSDGTYSTGAEAHRCRARVMTNEQGAYEFETVRPVAYEIPKGSGRWRSAHVHYVVRHPGYRELATELQFEGDPKADVDFNGRPPECVRPVEVVTANDVSFERTTLDLVLEPSDASS